MLTAVLMLQDTVLSIAHIMEKECFIRTMDALLPNVTIKEVATDAHPQINALQSKQNLCAVLFEVLTFIS